LPTQNELKDLRQRLARERHLDPAIIDFLRSAPKSALPMDVLRTAVRRWRFTTRTKRTTITTANVRKAIRLTSQIAMIVAAYDRIRKASQWLRLTARSRIQRISCCS